jgi:hypothetical protein
MGGMDCCMFTGPSFSLLIARIQSTSLSFVLELKNHDVLLHLVRYRYVRLFNGSSHPKFKTLLLVNLQGIEYIKTRLTLRRDDSRLDNLEV